MFWERKHSWLQSRKKQVAFDLTFWLSGILFAFVYFAKF